MSRVASGFRESEENATTLGVDKRSNLNKMLKPLGISRELVSMFRIL
jgi:hypothetical protein